MTNITELAQRMKAAAEKATPGPWYVHDKPCEDGNYGIDTSDKEFLAEAVVWWGFARQSIWREEDAKYIALANPANILALVEALASEKRICSTWRKTAEANGEKLEKAQQRIAELESRTVTVKLPKRSVGEVMHMSGFGRDYAEGWCAGNDNAIHEISNTAGIMVEDE